MLQQTTVATVKGYFEYFLERWPTVIELAAAELDDVLHAWQGLGYYARAQPAQMRTTGGQGIKRPVSIGGGALLALPGIGPYTAAAIAAIAFDRAATPVDGNIERVMSRLYRISEPLPGPNGRSGSSGGVDACLPVRRLCASRRGPGGDNLHSPEPGLYLVSLAGTLCGL